MAEKNVELKGYQAEACEAQGNQNSVVCGKRKDHNVFIPVSDFLVHHLPERYRDGDIVSTTQALARLVVWLQVPVEDKLPVTEPCPHSLESFEACELKEMRKATARVKYVEMVREADNKVCQCPECMYREDEDKENDFSLVVMVTSTHNVYDVDITKVVCVLNYDDMGDTPVKLYGCSIKTLDIKKDRCEFYCCTHDAELRNYLINNIKAYMRLNTYLSSKYAQEKNMDLVILISHPHGLRKRVSVGQLKRFKVGKGWLPNTYYTQYFYDTPTCAGSSGAPVFVVGKVKGWTHHPHWGYERGLSFSAMEWEEMTDQFMLLVKSMGEKGLLEFSQD